MSDETLVSIVALICFIIAGFVGGFILEKPEETQYLKAIAECEKELPRNQKCKIIGVIDNEH